MPDPRLNPLQSPELMTDNDLIAALSVRSDSVLALRELGRRRSPHVYESARIFVAEKDAPIELRSTAAIELGRLAVPENQTALIKALNTTNPILLKHVAGATGRIGNDVALEHLEGINISPENPAYPSVEFAKSLISYRLRLDSHRLLPPSLQERLPLNRQDTVALPVEHLDPIKLEAIQRDIESQLPAIPIINQGAVQFTCRNTPFWIVLTETFQDLAGLQEKSGVAAVVFKKTTCSESKYFVCEYILTNPPKANNDVELVGVRTFGAIAHGGEISLNAGGNSFNLGAANTLYSPALQLKGVFDEASKQMRLDEFLVSRKSVEKQQRQKVPQLSR